MIYLDHNATTPLLPEVRDAMLPFLEEEYGNASSVHRRGAAARTAIEEARVRLAQHVRARPSEIVFTSGGTEANNAAIFGRLVDAPSAHVVASPIEHSSVVAPLREAERRGAVVTWLPVDGEGRVDPAAVERAVTPATRLVTVGWANSEIGTIQDIASIAAACRRLCVPLHVDAVQALGRLPIDVTHADLCSFSAHKLGGPKGCGALFVRQKLDWRPLLFGGAQERGSRAGTENVAAVVGFGVALRHVGSYATVAEQRERLWRGIAGRCGAVRRHSPAFDCLPNTLHVGIEGVRGEALVAALDLEGVAASVGSACAAGAAEPSHVLRAIGCSEEQARDGVRFSLGWNTTAGEIDAAIDAIVRVVERMRDVGAATAAVGS